ncbi:hypothetical protein FIU87_03285 [Bacillus sp. THAF10]|uniref:hypothetical protein n=1 Tax=Bacillus sp. THAF10 TaxID=2587848 RepID=UPI001267E320|nr:hypothetical protein [Bacillus sp. THAF10]QFT87665.1 hypothetical protein FIU87_03285 [Bacillus sp. THAF10]
MNRTKAISIIFIAILIFIVGYATGRLMQHDVSMEFRIGYPHSEFPNRVDYPHTFKNTDNQHIINNLLMIHMQKERIDDMDLEIDSPDIYMNLLSPTESVGLLESRLWFKEDGAIIAERNGISWDEVEFYKIPESDASYIKGLTGYE